MNHYLFTILYTIYRSYQKHTIIQIMWVKILKLSPQSVDNDELLSMCTCYAHVSCIDILHLHAQILGTFTYANVRSDVNQRHYMYVLYRRLLFAFVYMYCFRCTICIILCHNIVFFFFFFFFFVNVNSLGTFCCKVT